MPVLRSQRSKPSKRRDEEEMPPPPTTPPVTRTTRGKKVSKKEVPEVPKSPTPSTRSTRSARTKTRAKAAPEPEVEEIAVASPPSTRSTRSTRQKAGTSKAVKAKKEEEKKTRSVAPALNPTVQLSPLVMPAKSKVKKTASKRGRPKKEKRPVESSTETDLTEEESDMDIPEKGVSFEQLHRQHLVPLKTVLESGLCKDVTNYLTKATDKTTEEKQDKKFQELLSRREMPPPAAPAPKAKGKKGRQKRARSPENTPKKTTKVPESFNFADNDCQHQAKKKMIMDQETPEQQKIAPLEPKDALVDKMEEASSVASIPVALAENDADKKEKEKGENEEDMFEHSVVDLADDSILMEAETTPKSTIVPKTNKSETVVVAEIPQKEKTSKVDAVVKAKADATKSKIDSNVEAATGNKLDSKVEAIPKAKNGQKAEVASKTKTDSKVEAAPKTKTDSKVEVVPKTKMDSKPETVSKTKTDVNKVGEQSVKVNTEALQEKPTAALDKKVPALDATYVFDTPKDTESKLNTTYTPELFTDTPKSRAADQTIVISKHNNEESKEKADQQVLAPPSPESDSEGSGATNSASGKVSSLVDFFDKNKKEAESKKVVPSSSKTDKDEINMNITRSISPDRPDNVDKSSAPSNDLNSTYVLPSVKKTKAPSAMNVTVCVKKDHSEDTEVVTKPEMLKPIVPPPSFLQQASNSRFMHDSPASRTFVKEPPSLAVVVEEEDDSKDIPKSDKQSEKTRPAIIAKSAQKEKDKTKGVSSSSSSSGSSMKSASSQPNLLLNKKLPPSASKLTPSYGSTGKLNEISKSKPLEEAEKRRLELLQQKVESSKKKNAEWVKKTEKNRLEEEKRLKEKIKPLPSSTSTILKKPVPMAVGKPALDGAVGGAGFTKPKFNFGPSSTKMTGSSNMLPPLSKNPFHKPLAPPPSTDMELDDSFKSANERSFLDQTTEGHLSSYDITVYEDLDEDLKHRENKTVPKWASDKEALTVALFSMVYLPEYQNKLPGGFPKPDKSYKLFPSRPAHH